MNAAFASEWFLSGLAFVFGPGRIGEGLERRDVAETLQARTIVVVNEAVEEGIAVGVGDKEAMGDAAFGLPTYGLDAADTVSSTPMRQTLPPCCVVTLQPNAIIAYSTPIAAALQRESRAIPIVFVNVSDPVGSGLVANLARPGGNLTGLMLYEEGIIGKWLAMLKEIAPQLKRAALIANPNRRPTTISCVAPRPRLPRSP